MAVTKNDFDSERPCGDACPYPVADCWVCEQAPVNRDEPTEGVSMS